VACCITQIARAGKRDEKRDACIGWDVIALVQVACRLVAMQLHPRAQEVLVERMAWAKRQASDGIRVRVPCAQARTYTSHASEHRGDTRPSIKHTLVTVVNVHIAAVRGRRLRDLPMCPRIFVPD
jgi:hypothetical protein